MYLPCRCSETSDAPSPLSMMCRYVCCYVTVNPCALQAAATLAYAALAPEVLVEGAQVQGITRSSADVAAAQQAHEAGPECSKAYERLMPQEQQQEQQQQPAVLHRYLEDCAPSRPSLNARNEEEAARLYEVRDAGV